MQLPPPQKEVIPLFPATPSKGWGPVKLPFFENLFGGSTPSQQKGGGGGGGECTLWFSFHSEKFKNEKSTFNKLSALLGPSCLVKSQKIYNISAKP